MVQKVLIRLVLKRDTLSALESLGAGNMRGAETTVILILQW